MNREPSNEANRSEVIGNTVPGRRLMTRAAVFGLAYFLAHEIAFLIPDANQVLMAVWPASGIGLAALLLSPRQQWGVLLGVFFVAGNLANLSAGRPMLTSAGSMTANVLESLACAWLISRWCGGQVRLGHVLEVVALIVAATLVNAGSAFLGATTAAILSGGRFWQLYQSWWSANGLGILLVTPLIVARCRESRRSRFPGWGQSAEIAMLASAACGLSAFAFGPASTLPNSSIRPYLLVIILCWAGLRLGVRGTALLLLLIAGIAIGYTATGHSGFPLGGQDSTHRLLMVQLFLGVCGCFALLLAASQVERTGAEEALRYNQALLQSVTEDTSDAFYVKDTQGRYLMANAAAARFVGKSSEEVVGKNDTALFKPDEARQMMESDRRVLASGIAQTQEEVLTTREGKVSTLLSTKGPVRDAQGQVVGVFGITRDITERKQSEEAFERTAREWQTTFDATNDAIWILDNHHRVLRSNRTAEGYFHRPCHEMLGQHCWAIVHGATEPHPNCPFIRARQSGQRETMDLQQGQRWFEIIVDPIRDAAGQYDGAVHIVCDISERKRAEKTLRDSEELYISLVENLPQNVFRKDRDGRFLFGNQRFCQSAGHSLRKLVGKTDADFFPPNITKAYRQDDLRVMESGQALEQIEEHLSGDGRKLFVQVVRTPLRDASGTVMGIQGIFWDITERKQAEALKETLLSLTSRLSVASTSADLARSVFAAADRLWKWDSGTLEVNSADGATTDAVMCIDVVEGERRVVPPTGTRSNSSPRLRRIMAHGAELMLRTREQMKVSDSIAFGDTSRLSASLMCVPIRQRGKPVGVFSIQSYSQNAFTSADLQTLQGLADHCGGALERIQAEGQLQYQAALLDAATDAIYVRALDHTVTYWNAGAERFYGWPRAEVLGRKVTDFRDTDPAAFQAAQAVLMAQGTWSGELRKKSKAGREEVVFCRWTLLRDQQGQSKEVLAIDTDITEQKQLEAQFLRAQRMEGIGSLAGGIAHDLNNILAPILMVGPLLRGAVSDPESRQIIDMVETCAQRGSDIIKQLLTFARGKPGARVPLPARHFLNEMYKLICETFPRSIQARVDVPKDLWLILGDATQIHQTLLNLCVNARDAMPEGGTLTLAAENVTLDTAHAALTPEAQAGEYVRLSVTDTGTGIPPELLDRIFDPFFTTKEIGKGTGLGLATVLGIVRGHGGFVRVNSQVGQGTTFDLYLPASPEAKGANPADHKAPPPCGQGELILVVDDEVSVRDIVRQTLEKCSYRVLAAEEGAEALALFGQHRGEVRAVLLDMMMPGMDGPNLVQALRQLDSQLPLLGMTGLAERAGTEGWDALKLSAFLIKPFTAETLLVALHQSLTKPL